MFISVPSMDSRTTSLFTTIKSEKYRLFKKEKSNSSSISEMHRKIKNAKKLPKLLILTIIKIKTLSMEVLSAHWSWLRSKLKRKITKRMIKKRKNRMNQSKLQINNNKPLNNFPQMKNGHCFIPHLNFLIPMQRETKS